MLHIYIKASERVYILVLFYCLYCDIADHVISCSLCDYI